MNALDLRSAMAELLDGEPTTGPDPFRALAAGRRARRARQVRVGLGVGLVAVIAVALPVALSSVDRHASLPATPPVVPLPLDGPVTTIAPLCKEPVSKTTPAADGNFGYVPPSTKPCATGVPAGRLAAAFAVVRQQKVVEQPFAVTLPAGWVLNSDRSTSNGWVAGMGGSGSHVLDLRSEDGRSGVVFVTAPSPVQPEYAFDTKFKADGSEFTPQGGRALASTDAQALVAWAAGQAWLNAGPPVAGRVDGRPASILVPAPRTGAADELKRCYSDRGACVLFGQFTSFSDARGPESLVALGTGSARLVFFDALDSAEKGGPVAVVAYLWDKDPSPAGAERIRTSVQPILDSIRFGPASETP